ncbi:hypothetical protein PAMC26577_14460 [Caballeronia sordidicola]|uniref:Uncharacterized protein n=1 Tax=Caballeronia sordidicola TaxID=196367 RepID=A0A242MU61_CABSO|nr:hypothetical protein PAMC26577_14460 [Caballeronia sordidicola]
MYAGAGASMPALKEAESRWRVAEGRFGPFQLSVEHQGATIFDY